MDVLDGRLGMVALSESAESDTTAVITGAAVSVRSDDDGDFVTGEGIAS
jgi:hypothetical protein